MAVLRRQEYMICKICRWVKVQAEGWSRKVLGGKQRCADREDFLEPVDRDRILIRGELDREAWEDVCHRHRIASAH